MAVISVNSFKREQQIIKALEEAPDGMVEKITSIRDILVDMKQSSGKKTIVYVLKYLYHDDTKKLSADLAKLTMLRENANPPSVDEFEVLSSIWPSILKLCTVDDEFFVWLNSVDKDERYFYQDLTI